MPTHRVVKLDELSQYFHLPEKAVAKQLGVCLTSLKKICRQNGITRWPYRKLKSLDKKINKLESALTTSNGSSDIRDRWELLLQEKKNLPFVGNSDESDEESSKCPLVVPSAVSRISPVSSTSTADVELEVEKQPTPPTAAEDELVSAASTPNVRVTTRAIHSMLEKRLRQVGCVATHRQQLAHGKSSVSTSMATGDPFVILDCVVELAGAEDDSMASDSAEMSLEDFYQTDSSPLESERSAPVIEEENLQTTSLPESFSFSDPFPLEETTSFFKLTDSLFSDEFLMPPMSS
mmetsp:Transcript_28815/g.66582  ORF Transcript_28815/g.66582 Transcript_28815/m.66582 type:complete len:292 (-) Transcript_28815:47-922(-)|eukprot:CAMPEP_0114554698 /NCGR_PEP_ID=MMETSP0114-20121206/8351_1 /TAXON_ID=31324 /ORGANISM="Goniomonas sp, Strain m" /LENGTH=291 /DNA_ID=CAMNT_0001739767 /DNA_START=119 /DNA_END=994 /DNA_ORIENTATION=-